MTLSENDPQWHRLHASSLLFRFGALGKALLIPGLVIFGAILFGGRDGDREDTWQLWAMVLFLPAVAFELFRYMTLRYRFAADELVIRQGLVFRNERHIPYKKMQNIDLQQNPLHRMFGVASVKLDTAGGAEAEAHLKVLSMDAIETMRSRVFAERQNRLSREGGNPAGARAEVKPTTGFPPSREGRPVFGQQTCKEAVAPADESAHESRDDTVRILHLPLIELIKLGSISGRGMALVAIVIGLGWEFGLFEKFDFREWFENGIESGFGLGLGVFSSVIMGLVALIALQVLSIIWTILRFHNFTLERSGDDLRIRCGLWTKNSATVPRRRIQVLSIRESLFHRMYGRVSVRIETAGGKQGDDKHDSISEKWIVPLLPKDELPRVLNELQPGVSLDDVGWQGLARTAPRRMIKKAVIWGVLLGALGLIASRPWGALAIIPVVAWFVFLESRDARYTAWAMTERGLFFRSGAPLTKKISITAYEKLQSVVLVASPFDRRHRHAGIRVDTAGAGPADHRISIPYLEADVAREGVDALHARTEKSAFRWS